jgi:hypothetical protein
MKTINARVLALGIALLSSPALAEKKPQPTGLELQQIQTRDFDVPKDVTFPAVMSVLQDAGYRINSADKDTGLITGQGSSTAKMTYNILWGIGNKKRSPVVSAYIEQRGPNVSRVRLSFVMAVTKGGIYGTRAADEEPILDPAAYTDAFEKISQAVFIRQAVDGIAPAVAPLAPAVAAAEAVTSGSPPPK